MDDTIALHTSSERGRNYEYGSIAHKLYIRGAVPLDEELEVDLERMLQAYDAYLNKTGSALFMSASTSTQKVADTAAGLASSQPSSAPRVFVSHAHHDSAYCRQFVDGLKAFGLDVWYDEQGIEAGAAWLATIQEELESRELFLLVVTPES